MDCAKYLFIIDRKTTDTIKIAPTVTRTNNNREWTINKYEN